jgi:cell surface protein SprA
MKNFDQTATLNYTLPLDKVPVTDWLGADYRYQVRYEWRAGPLDRPDQGDVIVGLPDELDFRNVIQNSREQNVSGRVDMVKLYNKIKFLKELNTPPRPQPARSSTNPRVQQPPDTTKAAIPGVAKGLLRLLMSLRGINGTYQVTEGTLLSGFNPAPKFLGMDDNWSSPGWGFVLGSQDPNIRFKAAQNGWLTQNKSLTVPFTQRMDQLINIRGTVEPSPDLKILIDLKKETMNSYQEIFRYSDAVDESGIPVSNRDEVTGFASLGPNRSGSYRISFLTIKTAFNSSNNKTESEVFRTFEENLEIMRNRLSVRNPNNNNGNPEDDVSYDAASQDVIIPAFIAAYSGKNAATVPLTPFPKMPLPNWRIDYTGLSKIEFFKNMFQSITVSHAYQSSYGVTNYSSSGDSLLANPNQLAINKPITDYNNSYFGVQGDNSALPTYVISQVLISEQFSPLIGINVRTKSRLTANFQYKTKRDLSLNVSNAQITEMNSKDVSLEVGFTKNNMKLPFRSDGRLIVLKNDVTFRMNVTVSDTRTIQRKIAELSTITNGNINFQLRPNISYVVNQKLNIQLYFERTINEPQVSNSYRRATTRFGAQVRFSLAQ